MDRALSFKASIPLNTSLGIEFFKISNIVYFYIENHKVSVLLTDGQIIMVYHTLKELESFFADHHFYRCHAARLINLDHVKRYNHKTCIIELTNNLFVKVANYRKVNFKRLLYSTLPPPPLIKRFPINNLLFGKISFELR